MRRAMSHFKRKESESVSRQQAAERLTDLAYALTAGPPLALTLDGRRITVPLPDELFLKGEMRSADDGVELELELTWSTAQASSDDESDSIKRGRPSQSGAPEGAKAVPRARSGR
jgi:amphi-Trp domain-containing protein